jgi:2-keto-4-pentenoate hydratase/2-oxohepta-3-ene-1,7-dioic acid hydratase in catechol pathway
MKVTRYLERSNNGRGNRSAGASIGIPKWGCIEEDILFELEGDPLKNPSCGKKVGPYSEEELLAPCQPRKVIAAAINYHGATDWQEGQTEPLFFFKSPNSVCSVHDEIASPFTDAPTWSEAELAIVISKTINGLNGLKDVASSIFGYTVANDVSCENLGMRDHHLPRSKAADTFCPLGHYIDTQYDPQDRTIESYQNDLLVRKGSTKDLFWDSLKIVYELSRWVTLDPWDVILTGSPPLSRPLTYLEDGDSFTCIVDGFPNMTHFFRQKYPLDLEVRRKFAIGVQGSNKHV